MTAKLPIVLTVSLLLSSAGCYQGIQPDSNPPSVHILKWERNPDGTQGSQTTIQPNGQFTVSWNWLGPNQADIRVYGEGTYGVRAFTVSGTGVGTASTKPNSGGQFWTAPGPLTAHFPTHVEAAPAGTTRNFMVFHLDSGVLLDQSCGTHSYNGAPPNAEYFLDTPATWTITATAENGSGLKTTGTFTIKVQ